MLSPVKVLVFPLSSPPVVWNFTPQGPRLSNKVTLSGKKNPNRNNSWRLSYKHTLTTLAMGHLLYILTTYCC